MFRVEPETVDPQARPAPVPAAPRPLVAIAWPWLVLFLLALLAPWGVLAWLMTSPADGPRSALLSPRKAPPTTRSAATQVSATRRGQWGELRYTPIDIVPPTEFIMELNAPAERTAWQFPAVTKDQFDAFINQGPLTADQKARIHALTEVDSTINGFIVRPDADLVQSLSPESRAYLYRYLSLYSPNADQANAFRVPFATLRSRLTELELPPTAIDLVEKLTYRNGRFGIFGDLSDVLPTLKSPDEIVALLKALAETSTFIMRLHVDGQSDLDALANYWGLGGRSKDIRPLLESLSRLPGGESIDISHLIPSFARRRIYTFPRPTTDPVELRRDCHWAAMNFFSEIPDDRFTNLEVVAQTIQKDYYPVFGDLQLGDLVLYMRTDDQAIHSAVYIADGVVYTKNGSRFATPFILMRMEDLHDFYPSDQPLKVKYFRRKDL